MCKIYTSINNVYTFFGNRSIQSPACILHTFIGKGSSTSLCWTFKKGPLKRDLTTYSKRNPTMKKPLAVYLLFLCFPILPTLSFSTLLVEFHDSSAQKEHQSRIKKLLDRSVFSQEKPPESLLGRKISVYDPILTTVLSSLYSELPEKTKEYSQIKLPPVTESGYISDTCPDPMRAFVKLSKKKNPHTFIILPGAWTSWESGAFNNKTIAVLEKQFDDPNIIGFDGYLTPHFIKQTCYKIPWNFREIATDMHHRLRQYLKSHNVDFSKTGVIGYGSGGAMALVMLSADRFFELHSYIPEQRVFGLGGAVFSPSLHGRVLFYNLDASVRDLEHRHVLTPLDLLQVNFLWKFWDWKFTHFNAHVALYEKNPNYYRETFFNKFTQVELRNTVRALDLSPDNINGELNYYNVYMNTGLRKDMEFEWNEWNHLPLVDERDPPYLIDELNTLYDFKINPTDDFHLIDRPLLVYFSQDDPILSNFIGAGQPKIITAILNSAQKNPHITVFNPKYGGHVGSFLDPIFEDLIHAVFCPFERESPQACD